MAVPEYPDTPNMKFDVPHRMRAARQLAGLPNVKDLAAKIGQRGLATKTLRAIEQGTRTPTAGELNEIAYACGVPLAWFTADFNRLDEISAEPRKVIATQLAAALQRAQERRANTTEDTPPLQEAGQ